MATAAEEITLDLGRSLQGWMYSTLGRVNFFLFFCFSPIIVLTPSPPPPYFSFLGGPVGLKRFIARLPPPPPLWLTLSTSIFIAHLFRFSTPPRPSPIVYFFFPPVCFLRLCCSRSLSRAFRKGRGEQRNASSRPKQNKKQEEEEKEAILING